MSTPILELRDVEAGYGPFRALFGVSLAVEAGEAVALVGANGAGKTTLARVASGLVAPSAGTVLVDGTEIGAGGPSAWRFVRAGVAHAPEGRSVFASLTVEENLALSFHRAFGRAGFSRCSRPGLPNCSPGWAGAEDSWRARCRGASSGCCRWVGCWWNRPGC